MCNRETATQMFVCLSSARRRKFFFHLTTNVNLREMWALCALWNEYYANVCASGVLNAWHMHDFKYVVVSSVFTVQCILYSESLNANVIFIFEIICKRVSWEAAE